jgi:putative ABC transport system permease protein
MNQYQLLSTIKLGIKSLMLHKLRSILTMLGIIFGVCSVIAMLAIGEGAAFEAQEGIKSLGSNNIIIRSVKPPEDNNDQNTSGRSFAVRYGLTFADSSRILDTIPGVKRVLPERIIRENARFGRTIVPVQVVGTYPFYPEIARAEVVAGRFLTVPDDRFKQNVCVITTGLANQLFPYQDPLKHAIKVGENYYRVVGVIRERNTAEQRPQSGKMEGEPIDNNVYIPLSTATSRFGETIVRRTSGSFEAETVELHRITVQMEDDEAVLTANNQIRRMLSARHEKVDYEVIVPLELLLQAKKTQAIFNAVLGSIAAISLIVGGIGIMNIMLATVTERTREIGIRRALGAKKKDITVQFLVETVVLAIGGGLIGVLVGITIPFFVTYFADMKTIVTVWSVLVAFGISAIVGILFGIYPANAAADLDPIDALRHE